MKIIDLYRKNKERFPKYVILIKVCVFYETYNEDCLVLNNLFGIFHIIFPNSLLYFF